MALLRSGTLETSWILSSQSKRRGRRDRQVIPAGGRSSVPVLPESFMKDTEFVFLETVSATPTQNISNYATGLSRLEVRRSVWGAFNADVLSKGDQVRVKLQIKTRYVIFTRNEVVADKILTLAEAFDCFGTSAASRVFTLPDLSSLSRKDINALAGITYYFADPVRAAAPPTITIRAASTDKIQIRTKGFGGKNAVVSRNRIVGTSTPSVRATVAVSLREPGLWVAESVALSDADPPVSLWT